MRLDVLSRVAINASQTRRGNGAVPTSEISKADGEATQRHQRPSGRRLGPCFRWGSDFSTRVVEPG
jgi:hypothetical protein